MEAVLHGVILSFGLILPLGVQNIFIFSQGASQSQFLRALPAAIAASLCDTCLILLSVLGLSMLIAELEEVRQGLIIVGVLFLFYMGYVTWKARPLLNKTQVALPINKQVIFAVTVSILNPHAILDTVGVIGTSALKYTGKEQVYFTTACIVVSWTWFFSLTIMGAVMKKIDGSGVMMYVFNKLSALFIWGTAFYLLIKSFGNFQ